MFGRGMTIGNYQSDASPGSALRDGLCILCFCAIKLLGFSQTLLANNPRFSEVILLYPISTYMCVYFSI